MISHRSRESKHDMHHRLPDPARRNVIVNDGQQYGW